MFFLITLYLLQRRNKLHEDNVSVTFVSLDVRLCVCACVSPWQSLVLDTPTVAGITSKVTLSTLAGINMSVCGTAILYQKLFTGI